MLSTSRWIGTRTRTNSPGNSTPVLFSSNALTAKRARALVEIGRDIVDDAVMRKPGLGLQPDFDRDRAEILDGQALASQLVADLQRPAAR